MKIHGYEINFHGGTKGARRFLKHDLSGEGFKKLMKKAKEESTYEFQDTEGRTFVLEYDGEEDSYSVTKKSS